MKTVEQILDYIDELIFIHDNPTSGTRLQLEAIKQYILEDNKPKLGWDANGSPIEE